MSKQIILSIHQREEGLLSLVRDSEALGFSKELIAEYKRQLQEVQEEIKRDKERLLKFNTIERGYKLKC